MQGKLTFGFDLLKRLFPTVKWDGSKDINCLMRKQVEGKDGLYLISLPLDYFDSLTDAEKRSADDVLADLEKHPYGNVCEPALPIPFTINQLMVFLECYRGIYIRLFEGDGCFTIRDVADYLKISAIEVFRQLQIGCEGQYLTPSVRISKPLNVKEIEGDGSIQQIKGLLEIDGIRGLCWTNTGVDGVNLFTFYEPCEEPWGAHYQPQWRARRQFLLTSEVGNSVSSMSFDRSELVVSHFSFLEYLWAISQETIDRQTIAVGSEQSITAEHEAARRENDITGETDSTEKRLVDVVQALFWSQMGTDFNRPTEEQIVDWIVNGYGGGCGITKKAAQRIYKVSKPDNIPNHGNLPNKSPFPDPPHPSLPR